MSVLHTNNITNRDGTSGPTIAGITTVSSTGFMRVPTGNTQSRVVADVENIVTNGLVLNLDAGRVSSYGDDGTTWRDLSGNNTNGTLANGVGFTADDGGSLIFDGVNDHINVPDVDGVTDFSNINNYTVDFWVYLNSSQNDTGSVDNDLVEKWSGSEGYPYTFRYFRASQEIIVTSFNTVAANSTQIQISHSNWWNICGVFNWSNSLLTLYGNGGIVSNSTILNLTGNITNSSALNIMRRGNNINYATGRLSSLKIYNRALTPQEVQQNYNALVGRYT